MGETCARVINIHREHCDEPAVAVVHPPPALPDHPIPVCAGHLHDHRRWGDRIEMTRG